MYLKKFMIQDIIDYINEQILSEKTELDVNTSLISSGLVDSINTLKLVEHIEDTYNVELEANEVTAENLDTIEKIISLIDRKKISNS